MKNIFLVLFATIFLAACGEENITDPVVFYDSGWRQYNVSMSVRCGIFQFEDAGENSPQEKINKMLLDEFHKNEAHILKTLTETAVSEFPSYRGELRGTSELYMCTPEVVSVKNKMYYYNNGAHGEIYETGLNFRILPDGSVKLMHLSDLFDNSKDWLTPLLIRRGSFLGRKRLRNRSGNFHQPRQAEIHTFICLHGTRYADFNFQ